MDRYDALKKALDTAKSFEKSLKEIDVVMDDTKEALCRCEGCGNQTFIVENVVQIVAGRMVSSGYEWPVAGGWKQYRCWSCGELLVSEAGSNGQRFTPLPKEE